MYKHLFGPVPSRRLGMSLGVDLVPRKVCSLDCVYCEVGATTRLTVARKEYIPLDKVKTELADYFENNPDPDTITFSGYGEPTLNTAIGDVLQYIREHKPGIQTAVLTNGTLFRDGEVRSAISEADLVLPSLDAATQEVFEKINRPETSLRVAEHIRGLAEFRREFNGKIWLEIFILPGYNDTSSELSALKNAVLRIRPDAVQLNTLDRPGALPGLKKAPASLLESIRESWGMDNVQVIAAAPARKNIQSYRNDVETAVLETISRRPCTLDDLTKILGLHVHEINKYLDVLEAEQGIEAVRSERGVFYQIRR